MRAITAAIISVLFALSVQLTTANAKSLTPASALKVRWPSHPKVSPDGSWVVFQIKDTAALKSQIHLYRVSSKGGEVRRLTHSGKRNTSAAISPDGQHIAFVSDRGEKGAQIYVMDARLGEPRAITKLPGGAYGPIWSPDSKMIAFVSRVKNKDTPGASEGGSKAKIYDDLLYRHWNAWDDHQRAHIFVVPLDGSRPPKDLTPGPHHAPTNTLNAGLGYTFVGNDRIAFVMNQDKARATSTNNDIFIVKTRGGKPRKLTTNKAWDSYPVGKGQKIAYLAFARAGYEADQAKLRIIDLSGKDEPKAPDLKLDRSLRSIAWSPGGTLYLTAYDHGYRALYKTGPGWSLTKIFGDMNADHLAIGGKSDEETTLVFVQSSLSAPPELYAMGPGDKAPTPITDLNGAWRKRTRLGKVSELTVKSKDGKAIHGFIVEPPNTKRGRRYPLLMLIHGGPQGAWRNSWGSRWNPQLFAARGFVVAAPNIRGSVGYGQNFTDAVTKNWGGGPYEDVMAFTEAVAKRPSVNSKLIAAAGASYGGYMVNWIAGHTDRFSALISHAGVYNLESFWGDTEELWFPEWEFGGTPWESRSQYEKWSPHLYIHQAKTPTLVIHGQLDYRVHLSQSQQMFSALRRRGVPARFVYFPDEGHWILKPANFLVWYKEMFAWLAKYCGD